MKFEPNMQEIAKIPEPFRTNWAEALRSSKQYKGMLVNTDAPDEMCCLGVACVVAGVPYEDMLESSGSSRAVPRSTQYEMIGINLMQITVATRDLKGKTFRTSFAPLNDKYLTHPQIADLLDGKTVETEDD